VASVELCDTTLRDGMQMEGIAFSVIDKLNIARKIDELGVHFIEGGWPGSNPKDAEFFNQARNLSLQNSRLVAFGSTRRPRIKVETDTNLQALASSGVTVVAVVGKSSALQVTRILETSLEENLSMISDSIHYLKRKGLLVFFDGEHFFDGFKADQEYALRCLEVAAEAGANCLVLCDTNGGSLPAEITAIIGKVRDRINVPLSIHAHNDCELAVANTLAAVSVGVDQVQGTINGYGERCGNANLCSVIPDLKLKMGVDCISDEQLAKLTEVSHYVSEAANLIPNDSLPYVGSSAFSHKGGLHVSGVTKWTGSYQHIEPNQVGNRPNVLVSELSGRKNIICKAREWGLELPTDGKKIQSLLDQIKLLESRGFQYENAEASFELLVQRSRSDYHPPFELVDFMVVVERRRRPPAHDNLEEMLAEATVKVRVGTEVIHTAAEGDGPINALDHALRKALLQFYPSLTRVRLVDFKVRILEESVGTESQVRVLIESGDGTDEWRTVGSSTNIIEASWLALADGLEYWLLKQGTAGNNQH
jgi:2-isopropylmalate synthase